MQLPLKIDTSNAHNAATLGPLMLAPIHWKGNSPDDKRRKTRADFSLMEMDVELKKLDTDDAFEGGTAGDETAIINQNFEKGYSSLDARKEDHALVQLSRQFRRFSFSLFVIGKFVRFIHWDRAGATVSSRFDYTERSKSSLLAKFLWNHSHSSPRERDIDTGLFDRPEDRIHI